MHLVSTNKQQIIAKFNVALALPDVLGNRNKAIEPDLVFQLSLSCAGSHSNGETLWMFPPEHLCYELNLK